MPESTLNKTGEGIFLDEGMNNVSSALYSSVESVINRQLDALWKQLSETKEVSVGTLLGMADNIHSLSWNELARVLSSNLKQVTSNIISAVVDPSADFLDNKGNLDYKSIALTYLNRTSGDVVESVRNNVELKEAISRLEVVQNLSSGLSKGLEIYNIIMNIATVVEPLFPVMEIMASFGSSFMSGGSTVPQGTSQSTQLAMNYMKQIALIIVQFLKKTVFDYKIKVPRILLNLADANTSREAYQVWASSLESQVTSDSERDKLYEEIKKYLNEDFYSSVMNNLEWWNKVSGAISKIDKTLQDISLSNQFANSMMDSIIKESLGASGVSIPSTVNWILANAGSSNYNSPFAREYEISIDDDDIIFMSREIVNAENDFTSFYSKQQINKLIVDNLKSDGLICDSVSKTYDEEESENNPTGSRKLFNIYNDVITKYHAILAAIYGEVRANITEAIPVIDYQHPEYTGWNYIYTDSVSEDSINNVESPYKYKNITEIISNEKTDLQLLKENDPAIINRALHFDTMAQHFWNTNSKLGSSDPDLQVSIPEIVLGESNNNVEGLDEWLDNLSLANISEEDIKKNQYGNDTTGEARMGWVKRLIYFIINLFRRQALKDGQASATKAVFAATGNVISFLGDENSPYTTTGSLNQILSMDDDEALKLLASLLGPGHYGRASGLLVGRFASPAIYDPTSSDGSKVKIWRFETSESNTVGTLYNENHVLFVDSEGETTKQIIAAPLSVKGKNLPETPEALAIALAKKGLFGGNQAACVEVMEKIAGRTDKKYEGIASIFYDELSLRFEEKMGTIFKTVSSGWENFPLITLKDVTCNLLVKPDGVSPSLYGQNSYKNTSSDLIDSCLDYWDYVYNMGAFHFSPGVEGYTKSTTSEGHTEVIKGPHYYRSSYVWGPPSSINKSVYDSDGDYSDTVPDDSRISHPEDAVSEYLEDSYGDSYKNYRWKFGSSYEKTAGKTKTIAHFNITSGADNNRKWQNKRMHWDIDVDFITPWGLLGSESSGTSGDATVFYPLKSNNIRFLADYIGRYSKLFYSEAQDNIYLLSKKDLKMEVNNDRSTCYFYNKNHEVVLFKVSAVHKYPAGFSSINSVDITLNNGKKAVGTITDDHSQNYGSHIHSINKTFRGYAGPTYVYKLSPVSDAPEGENALVKNYYGEDIPLPSYDTVSYPSNYFEKSNGFISNKDLSRLSGSFILPGIPDPVDSDYRKYKLKNSGLNLIGIQNLINEYDNTIKGALSRSLSTWPSITGWEYTDESLESCKKTDVLLSNTYKITDSIYSVKNQIGAICNQGAFKSLGYQLGQNPYDYNLEGLYRMMEPLKKLGQRIKEIFDSSRGSFSRESCQELDHLMGSQPWLSIADHYDVDPSSEYCARFEATKVGQNYYYRNFSGEDVQIIYPERVVKDSESSTGLYYYAVDITKDCLLNFRKFINQKLEGNNEFAGIQYYEEGSKKVDKSSLYYKRYTALNSRMSRPQGPAANAAFFMANKKLIMSSENYNNNKIEEYREIIEALPVPKMDEYAYIPTQEASGSQLEIRGSAYDSTGLCAPEEGKSLQIGKFYNKSLMEEIRSRIHDKCVLVCAPCPVKNSCPFYDETEVLKKYVPEVTTIDLYVKDNMVDFLDYTENGGLSSVKNSQGSTIDIPKLRNQFKAYADIVMDPERERDLEEIRDSLNKDVLGFQEDGKYVDELGWLQGGRWGSLISGVDLNGNPSEDAKYYRYLYDAIFLNDEDTSVNYRLSDNSYPVGIQYMGDNYTGKIRIKVPATLKIFDDASLDPKTTKVYLISDDTKDDEGNEIKSMIYLNTMDSLRYTFDLTDDGNPNGSQSSYDTNVYAEDVAQASLNCIKGYEDNNDQIWQESIRKTVVSPNSSTSNYSQVIAIKGRDRIGSNKIEVVGDVNNMNETEVLRGKPYMISYVNFLRKVRIDMNSVKWADSSNPADVERARQTLPFMKTNVRLVLVKN